MNTYRYGRKLKLPSTAAIKHQLLMLMLEDEIRAIPAGGSFIEKDSAALTSLHRLNNTRAAH
jgi:hypothetical protein